MSDNMESNQVKRKVVTAHYCVSPDIFLIPAGVTLIEDGGDDDTDGSWWIKWGVLHYRWNGKWMKLEAIVTAEIDHKRPTDKSIEDAEDYLSPDQIVDNEGETDDE